MSVLLLLGEGDPLAPKPYDVVGLTDLASPAKTIAVTVTDTVGITDATVEALSVTIEVTDAIGVTDATDERFDLQRPFTDTVGITDQAIPVHTIARSATDTIGLLDPIHLYDSGWEATDPVGITDSVLVVKLFVATDPVGITDTVLTTKTHDLPSIDGATDVPGVGALELFDPVANPINVDLPSIDGASAPSGIVVRTQTEIDGIAADNEVYAHLYNAAGALLSTLDDQISVEWQDTFDDVGVGTLTLNRHDADAALVVPGTQVYCYLYGDHVFTFVIKDPPEVEYLDVGEEATEVLSASGGGRNTICEDGLVYPPLGVDDPLNPAHRLYSFASYDYVEGSGWVNAVQQYRADELDPHRYQNVEWTYQSAGPEPDTVELVATPAPVEWPDPEAYWIWGQADRLQEGYNFFRSSFVLPFASTVAFCVTADNYYTLYLNGTALVGENVELNCWTQFKRVEVPLPAGTYKVAAVVENAPLGIEAPAWANPAGFLCSIFVPDPTTNEPETFLLRSNSSWRALPYPSTWPGWTPGAILEDVIAEAQARGELAGLTYDFSALSDSAGNPFPVTQGFSIPIGNSVLDVLNALVEQGWIDYRLAPGGLVLQVFVADWTPNSGVTLQASGVEATTNLVSYTITPQTTPKTRLLVSWSEGLFQLDDAAAQAVYGIKPLRVSVDSATRIEAVRRAQVILDNVKGPQDAIQAGLAPTGPGDRPYRAFTNGELLTVPTRTGAPSNEKLLAISVSHDEIGKAVIGLELNTRVFKRERQNEELLQQIGSGVTGSTKVRWSLYQTEALNK